MRRVAAVLTAFLILGSLTPPAPVEARSAADRSSRADTNSDRNKIRQERLDVKKKIPPPGNNAQPLNR